MSGSPASVLGFAVIFLVVGGLGGAQLGALASVIFLTASGALFAFFAVQVALAVRRRRAPSALEAELSAVPAAAPAQV
ncbi:hypothetical protein [Naasia sp. SYSU D00057]|uniref:hypothetical protein n=1 Tax=Naasia sp. SYSU D00057 TaxID=2817380 RepID=UPI001B302088|nr:hypothetical protein [Naasia sp. SYSU D00057]